MIYEDFVPLDDSHALVSRGESLTSLTEIARVPYALDGDRVRLTGEGIVLVTGKHLRLGNMHGEKLVYSDSNIGIFGAKCKEPRAIQPFVTDNGDVYWNLPYVTAAEWQGFPQGIYRNGELFLKHQNPGGSVGKPMVCGDWLYYEAREYGAKMPQGWSVCRMKLDRSMAETVCIGANPHPFDGKLFYTDFSMYPEDFDTYWIDHAL